ncbi:MAG: hypothetical protein IPM83_10430 [Ignavibacteria bacterium]|nr:hypothetical protein [Ignavibacteria bacterium]
MWLVVSILATVIPSALFNFEPTASSVVVFAIALSSSLLREFRPSSQYMAGWARHLHTDGILNGDPGAQYLVGADRCDDRRCACPSSFLGWWSLVKTPSYRSSPWSTGCAWWR